MSLILDSKVKYECFWDTLCRSVCLSVGLFMTAIVNAEVIEESFSSKDCGEFRAEVVFTDIELDSHGSDTIEITLTRTVKEKYADDAERILKEHEVTIEENRKSVEVKLSTPRKVNKRWQQEYGGTPLKSKLVVAVPQDCAVKLVTVTGDVDVGTVGGKLVLKSSAGNLSVDESLADSNANAVSGDVKFGKAAGSLSVNQVSGDLIVKDVLGDLKLNSVSGDVNVDKVFGSANLKSVAGDIRLKFVGDEVEVTSTSGDISLGLPDDGRFDFELSTMSGSVNSEHTVSGKITRRRIEGSANGGGTEIIAKTLSGDIRLSKAKGS